MINLITSDTMYNMTEIYNLISSPIFGNTVSLLSLFIGLFFGVIGIVGEYKFNILSRFKKSISNFRNEQAEIEMNFFYKPKKDFILIKNELKNYFIENYSNYRLNNEKTSIMSISFDIFTIEIINNDSNEIFFDVLKTGCGIRDLNNKVDKLISAFEVLDENKRLFDRLQSCEITLYLPHDLSYVKVYPPKGFALKDYSVEIQNQEDSYRTKVDVCLNHINASGHSFGEIKSLLHKLL